MKVKDFLNKTVAVSFEYSGETVTLTARQNALTATALRQLQQMADTQDAGMLIPALASSVVGWDLVWEENEPNWPVTVENLEKLPVDFLAAMVTALSEIWSGNAQRPKPSASLSADSAQSQTETVN